MVVSLISEGNRSTGETHTHLPQVTDTLCQMGELDTEKS